MGAESNKAAIRNALEAFNRHDLDTYLGIYDPSCRTHGMGPEAMDLAALRGFYEMIFAGFPDGRVDVDDLLAEGDRVAVRYTFRATHQGEFMGVSPSGSSVVMGGQTILRFAGGKIVERWQSADIFGLMQQIGAIPAAV